MIPYRSDVIARIKALPPLHYQRAPWYWEVVMWLSDAVRRVTWSR